MLPISITANRKQIRHLAVDVHLDVYLNPNAHQRTDVHLQGVVCASTCPLSPTPLRAGSWGQLGWDRLANAQLTHHLGFDGRIHLLEPVIHRLRVYIFALVLYGLP